METLSSGTASAMAVFLLGLFLRYNVIVIYLAKPERVIGALKTQIIYRSDGGLGLFSTTTSQFP